MAVSENILYTSTPLVAKEFRYNNSKGGNYYSNHANFELKV